MDQAEASRPLKILVPTDFSECAEAALDYARRVASDYGAEIDVLHVWSARTHLWGDAPKVIFDAPDLVETRPSRPNTVVRIRNRLEFGDASSTIVRVAASEDVDLIVMGSHGTTQGRHKAEGHVAQEVTRSAICPVVTVEAPDGDEEIPSEDEI